MTTFTFTIEAEDAVITNFDISRKVMQIATDNVNYLDPVAIAEMILAECAAMERREKVEQDYIPRKAKRQ